MMLSRYALRVPKGLGDVNSDAQAKFAAAGYTNVACAPQTVTYPGGSYTQNECTDGQGISMLADAANGMTVAQLKTQFANQQAYSGLTDAQLNQQLMALSTNPGGSTNVVTPFSGPSYDSAASGGGVAITRQTSAANLLATTPTQQQASQVPASSTQASQPVFNLTLPSWMTGAPSSSSAGTSTGFSLGASTIINGIPDLVVYGVGGLAALMLVMSMGGKHH